MLIRSVRFTNHPALGSLSIDFTDPATNEPFDTVILAGENGCGKTVILNEIFTMVSEPDLARRAGIIEVELDLDDSNRADLIRALGNSEFDVRRALIRYEFREANTWEILEIFWLLSR